MSTAIVWLRRDLRLHDNPALRAACETHDAVIPVYIFAPEEHAPWQPGAASRWWLHHSIAALSTELHKRNSTLILRRGPSLKTLRELAGETEAEAVYWNRLYEPSAIARDSDIKAALRDDGLQVASYNAALLWEPWTVETGQGGPYRVFTPFWRACVQRPPPAPDAAPKPLITAPAWPASLDLSALKLLPDIHWYGGLEDAWQPGEAGAQRRLALFCETLIDDYHQGRDRPDLDGVSQLSPHLHFGELSPRQVWQAVTDRYGGAPLERRGGEAYLREIGWREFAYHVLYHFPDSSEQPVQEKFRNYPWRDGAEAEALLHAWQRGRTGLPLVDAGMRQLWHSGWMHNRVRMVVASFLTKNCRIHWLQGARWFWDTLVDADLASNSLGWQWVAGSGFDAAPYFRIFNPVSQAEKHDPQGDYQRRWVSELEGLDGKALRQPWTLPNDRRPNYPEPAVDLSESRKTALAGYQKIK